MRHAALLVATIVGFGALWFGRAAWGGHFVADHSPGGDVYHLGTLYARWAHYVANGHLPLWFPEFAAGFPAASAWMYGLLYPGQLLYVVLPAEAAWTWSAILHMALGGLGMHLLVREETRNPLAGVTAGLAFALSEYMVGRVLCGHVNLLAPLAWAPWAFFAVTRIVAGSRSAALWGALCLALGVLSGHVQIWFYVAPFLVLFAAHRAVRAGGSGRTRRLLIAGALAIALAAVQWLPALELASLSERAGDESVGLAYFCAPAHQLASKVFPGVLGYRPDSYWAPETAEHEFTAIGGLLLLVLLLPALTRRAAGARFWVALVVAGTLLAPGVHNPLSDLLNGVPPFSSGRTPARALALVVLGVSVLVGHGVAHWTEGDERRRPGVWTAAAIAGAIGALSLALVLGRLAGASPPVGVVVAAVAAGVGTAAAALLALALRRRHPRAVLGLPALVVVAAALGGVPPADTVNASFFHTDWRAHLPPSLAEHRVHLLNERFPNVERQGLRTLRELCYLDAPWYHRFRADPGPERAAWLDVGVELAGIEPERLFRGDVGAADVLGRPYAARGAARLFGPARHGVADDAALAAIDGGSDELHLAGVSQDEREPVSAPGARSSVQRLPGDDPGKVEYAVETESASWLFVSEKHFPGWVGEVNGLRTRIYRANVMFRAVRVPPGRSKVRMTYRPAPLRWGAWISLTGLALTLGLLLAQRFRRRPTD